MSKTVSTDKARQGHWGRHLLIMLIAALLLAAVGVGRGRNLRRGDRAVAAGGLGNELSRRRGAAAHARLSAGSPGACGFAGTSTFSAFL